MSKGIDGGIGSGWRAPFAFVRSGGDRVATLFDHSCSGFCLTSRPCVVRTLSASALVNCALNTFLSCPHAKIKIGSLTGNWLKGILSVCRIAQYVGHNRDKSEYFTLSFRRNGSAGQAAAPSGISHILPGRLRRGGVGGQVTATTDG